jgi:hypothetical protein
MNNQPTEPTVEDLKKDLQQEQYLRERNQLIIQEKDAEISYLKKMVGEVRDENIILRQRIDELVGAKKHGLDSKG